MNPAPSHQELQDLIPAAALEILDDADARPVFAHLQSCAECTRLLDSYGNVVATLPAVLPERPLEAGRSDAVRARLLSRVRAQPDVPVAHPRAAGSRVSQSRPRPDWRMAWSGWAVAAGLAELLMVHHSVHRPVDYGWLAAGVLTFAVLGLAVYAFRQRAQLNALRGSGHDEQVGNGEPDPW